ncbi:triose-phosphate isomerase [Geothrix sp. PMB-07]|uniref:triose-phosphate isomerase n=1 Tax=Geothrix sp. PMB-07 TaxID=3068640 RepID=UPI0027428568|nr:triose-phosphate isomerase [Geothrix sp. PMB-07]WLT30268.1 triose-phosphate isomerase [Geothrix sp. PMB-07]
MRCVVANWKMNLASEEARSFCEDLLAHFTPSAGTEVGIAPPFTLLHLVSGLMRPKGIMVFGQNGHAEAKGAFTGEVSMPQLRDAGCSGVILGHSERRQFFGETDAALAKKIKAAWQWDLLPLLCIGETLDQRDAGQTLQVLGQQLSILAETGPGPLWVAYEPVWAIGTGRRAEAEQVREAHAFIRAELNRHFAGSEYQVPILYGGSVTPESFPELLGIPEVAGGLVGGASLDPKKFAQLVKQAS